MSGKIENVEGKRENLQELITIKSFRGGRIGGGKSQRGAQIVYNEWSSMMIHKPFDQLHNTTFIQIL